MKTWTVIVKALGPEDVDEVITLTGDEAQVDYWESGIHIKTGPEQFGYANLRIVPWSRVLDYREVAT